MPPKGARLLWPLKFKISDLFATINRFIQLKRVTSIVTMSEKTKPLLWGIVILSNRFYPSRTNNWKPVTGSTLRDMISAMP
jgi:hypothetical protein